MTAAPTAAASPASAPRGDTVLELRGVSKVFRDFWLRPRVKAVQDLDLTVKRGEVLGLLGPNGSGKSTTIKMILGLLYQTAGQISVLGKQPTDVNLKKRIGYLPEDSNLYRFLNAEETLDFYGRLFGLAKTERDSRVESLLDMVGLTAARYRPVGEYSKGMQRRVGLAQALINDPDLLILDEPTTGMDPIATRQIKDLILTLKQRGKTIILCTHLLGEVEDVCDRLVIMYGGKIRQQGTVEQLLTVEGKQAIEVSGGALDEETIHRLSQVLSGDGRQVESVKPPRQKLENLFLSVIDQANQRGEATTGAAVGKSVAGFLSDGAEGDALLEELATITPQPVQKSSDIEAGDDQTMEPDQAALDEISAQPTSADDAVDDTVPPPASAHPTQPAPPTQPAQPLEETQPASPIEKMPQSTTSPMDPPKAKPARSEAPADDDFLDDLLGNKKQ